jgi:putative Holliday junction resolvase
VRVIGIDLGSRRIGVAASDPSGTLASPLEVVERGADHGLDHARLARIVEETGAATVVVGLPLAMSGQATAAAKAVVAEVAELAAVLPVPVVTYDERLTTVVAHAALAAGGTRSRGRRPVVDKSAAAVILQSWMDRQAAARATEATRL